MAEVSVTGVLIQGKAYLEVEPWPDSAGLRKRATFFDRTTAWLERQQATPARRLSNLPYDPLAGWPFFDNQEWGGRLTPGVPAVACRHLPRGGARKLLNIACGGLTGRFKTVY